MGHIETAVAMYHAGQAIHEFFRGYTRFSGDEKMRRGSTLIPLVVVCVFGIEVALKAILSGQGVQPERTHDLAKLYSGVNAQTRQRIEEKARASVANIASVEALLTEHRDSLQEWRYMGDATVPLIVGPDIVLEMLRITIEVHQEYYSTTEQERSRDAASDDDAESKMQRVVSEYVKNVLGNDA